MFKLRHLDYILSGLGQIKPKYAIIPHIVLSLLCIHAFSLSFCFYWRKELSANEVLR